MFSIASFFYKYILDMLFWNAVNLKRTQKLSFNRLKTIMDDYSTEPRLIFSPLSAERYCELYELELQNFTEDVDFYQKHIPSKSSVLELGCGTGRIVRKLTNNCTRVVGLDISLPMLQRARRFSSDVKYICGDMRRFKFHQKFKTILIPYNTLNLLHNVDDILSCLKEAYDHLEVNGSVIAQIFTPTTTLISKSGQRIFQFQTMDLPCGGKVVKETLRCYSKNNNSMTLEERYRIRPAHESNEDLSHSMSLLAYDSKSWLNLFNQSGFDIYATYGSYQSTSYADFTDNCLLIIASKGK